MFEVRTFEQFSLPPLQEIKIAYATPISSVLSWFANHWTFGERIGRFPRWDFRLLPRTDAWEEEHAYPSSLSGAIVCGLRKSCTFPQIRNGDVLLSVNRQSAGVELDKFGLVTDQNYKIKMSPMC